MSVNAPPLMLGEETSSTPPSQNPSTSASVLKLLRKVNVAPEVTTMLRVVRYLSLTPFWSSTNASLGALSGVTAELTHLIPLSGGAPWLVEVHPAGMAGGVRASKFSVQGGPAGGVAVGEGVAVGAGVAVPPGVAVGPG